MPPVSLTPWQNPPDTPILYGKTVHLWRFPLTDIADSSDVLNQEETQRAQRLRVPGKARAFVVARTRLRQILGIYLDIPPGDVLFRYNESGKPFLADTDNQLFFNLSHSGSWGLCALSRAGEVGVDIETADKALAFQPLAKRFFSAAENSWLQASSENRMRRNFFRLWTRKEAWLKGKGGGFSESALELDPALVTSTSACAGGWWLRNTPVIRGYVSALAVAGEVEEVERFHFPKF